MKNTIFEKYQVRKTKKQKTAFIELVEGYARENGYQVTTEKGSYGSRNIVVGNPDSAKVVFGAHYDTCPLLPFPNFITPKNIGIYILYQILLTLAILFAFVVVAFLLAFVLSALNLDSSAVELLAKLGLYALLCLLMFGPANKHTANDNTSGVMTLLTLMEKLPEELRGKCAFVFFDLEEMGVLGSGAFAKKHKNVAKNTLLLNFDCVSDGDNFILTLPKQASDMEKTLKSAFESDKFNVEILKKGYIYPSDQMRFKKGVGIAALKRFKDTKILYMNRIHTRRDTVYQEENIEFLSDASVKLVDML